MKRKRMTQVFPFLLRFRKAQKRFCFYAKMRLDRNRYALTKSAEPMSFCVYETRSLLLNDKTGFDMKYQRNKAFNLRIAAEPLNGVVIRPTETFSFWRLVGSAAGKASYKEGLTIVDGKMVAVKGGGLCQLSNILFWMFLHTPLTVVERHPHQVKDFPSQDRGQPDGVDATISEGWLDLKVRNQTDRTFQIELAFDDTYLHGRILSDRDMPYRYDIVNRDLRYFQRGGRVYQQVSVIRRTLKGGTGEVESERSLYTDVVEIGYELPDTVQFDSMEK